MANYSLTPDWKPLEEMVGREACHFMFMGFDDSEHIRLYKHIDNRRYLNIDDLGRCWKFVPPAGDLLNPRTNCYVPISKDEALANVGLTTTR